MRQLHILRSEPDETVEKLMEGLSEEVQITVMPLFCGEVDWMRLVDDIYTHDSVICWW